MRIFRLPWTKDESRFEERDRIDGVEKIKIIVATNVSCMDCDATGAIQIYISLHSEKDATVLVVHIEPDVRIDAGLLVAACDEKTFEAAARGPEIDLALLNPLHLNYKRCSARAVTADAPAPPEFVEQLTISAGLIIQATAQFGEPRTFLVSLNGFKAAFAGTPQNRTKFSFPPPMNQKQQRDYFAHTESLKAIADHYAELSVDDSK